MLHSGLPVLLMMMTAMEMLPNHLSDLAGRVAGRLHSSHQGLRGLTKQKRLLWCPGSHFRSSLFCTSYYYARRKPCWSRVNFGAMRAMVRRIETNVTSCETFEHHQFTRAGDEEIHDIVRVRSIFRKAHACDSCATQKEDCNRNHQIASTGGVSYSSCKQAPDLNHNKKHRSSTR
jgi:hypothetical protein